MDNRSWKGWLYLLPALCFLGAIAISALLTYGFERPVARALSRRWDRLRGKRT